jgi:hypothetical protein
MGQGQVSPLLAKNASSSGMMRVMVNEEFMPPSGHFYRLGTSRSAVFDEVNELFTFNPRTDLALSAQLKMRLMERMMRIR